MRAAAGMAGTSVQLQLDVGNTRLKWRLLRCSQRAEGELSVLAERDILGRGFLIPGDYPHATDALAALGLEVQQVLGELPVDSLRVATVAAAELSSVIERWARQSLAVEAQFAYVTVQAAGVMAGYDNPSQLGVDRWLAVLAASRYGRGGFVVVDCGSAVTVDVLSAGQHLGGYIVPGLRLMNRALFGDTARVKVQADWQRAELPAGPGRDTAAAVSAGLPLMVVGLVQEVLRRQREKTGQAWKVLLCGGDARPLSAMLPAGVDFQVVDDLVLDGLWLAAVKPLSLTGAE